jgi:hypothetical protein
LHGPTVPARLRTVNLRSRPLHAARKTRSLGQTVAVGEHVPVPTTICIRPRGLRAVAWNGRPLGRVCEILRSRGSGRAWAIVRPGRFRRPRVVPMVGARYEAALVRLPVAADQVLAGPRFVRRNGLLDDRDLRHYGPFESDAPRAP